MSSEPRPWPSPVHYEGPVTWATRTNAQKIRDAIDHLVGALQRMHVRDDDEVPTGETMLSLNVLDGLRELDDALDGQIARWAIGRAASQWRPCPGGRRRA